MVCNISNSYRKNNDNLPAMHSNKQRDKKAEFELYPPNIGLHYAIVAKKKETFILIEFHGKLI